jgi:DNA-binding transcriptional regulator YhcF (GntR family)
MKIWISKGSEVPVHEQLTTQIMLAVASGELKPDQRLPSIRALARRFDIHPNTVNCAYRTLACKGWLDIRKGSGVYVRSLDQAAHPDAELELDQLISTFLNTARKKGYSLKEIRNRIKGWLTFQPPDHFLVIEPSVDLQKILIKEIEEATRFRCFGASYEECGRSDVWTGSIPVAIYGRADIIQALLPQEVSCIFLKSRSVQDEIQQLKALPPTLTIAVISGWAEFVKWAHATLVAAAIDPARLSFRNSSEPGWEKGLTPDTFVITDMVQHDKLPHHCRRVAFRLIAQSSLEELRSFVTQFLSNENERPQGRSRVTTMDADV